MSESDTRRRGWARTRPWWRDDNRAPRPDRHDAVRLVDAAPEAMTRNVDRAAERRNVACAVRAPNHTPEAEARPASLVEFERRSGPSRPPTDVGARHVVRRARADQLERELDLLAEQLEDACRAVLAVHD